jgi:pyridoxine 5-phosphate synthase
MVKLSVNINKIALIRNARGGNVPDLLEVARRVEEFGAQGITVHPRPDQRHITYKDVENLKSLVKTELNVEGYPSKTFIDLVCRVKPHQVTLVPDAPDAITSDAGWDTRNHESFLTEVVSGLKGYGIRVSIFMDTDTTLYESAARTGTDRIELYTEAYAKGFETDPQRSVVPYVNAARRAHELGLGINAGHDLNMHNLKLFVRQVPHLQEVSIGHALISEALYLGLENTIQIYLRQLS